MSSILRASWQAGIVAVAILLLRGIMGNRLPARWRGWLWLLVIVRLLTPTLPSSPVSVFNLVPREVTHASPFNLPIVTVTVKHEVSQLTEVPISLPPVKADPMLILFCIWLGGAMLMAVHTAWVNIGFVRRLRKSAKSAPQELNALIGESRLKLVMTDAVSSPSLFGLFRPKLLIPPDISQRLSREQIHMVFQHEQAHFRRRDLWVGWLWCVCRIIHWFNPLMWVASMIWRSDAESACDQAVLSASDSDQTRDYGLALLQVAANLPIASPPRPGIAMMDGKRQLRRRIADIAGFRRPAMGWSIIAGILFAVIGVAGLTDALRAAPATAPATKPTTQPEGMITKVYDIRDLILPGMTNPFASLIEISPDPDINGLPKSVDGWAVLIKSVTPDAWVTGTTIDTWDYSLIITAPAITQAAVEKFLADVRSEFFGQELTVTTTFVACDIQTLVKYKIISEVSAHNIDGGMLASAPKGQLDAFLADMKADDAHAVLAAPRVTLLSGQSGEIDDYTSKPYIADVIPVASAAGSEMKPVIRNAMDGCKVGVTAYDSDGKEVMLDLLLEWHKLLGFEEKHFASRPDLLGQTAHEQSSAIETRIQARYGEPIAYVLRKVRPMPIPITTTPAPATEPDSNEVVLVIITANLVDTAPKQQNSETKATTLNSK